MRSLFSRSATAHIEVEQLSAYLDGQLALADRTRLDEHLRGCAVCRGELESLRRTVALVQALPRVPVPRAFTLSQAQVGAPQRKPQPVWGGGLLRGFGLATALALVAIVATTVLRQPVWAPGATVAREVPAAVVSTQEAAPAAVALAPEVPQARSVEVEAAEPASEAVGVMMTPESAAESDSPPAGARAAIAPEPTAEAARAKSAAPAPPEPTMAAPALASAPEMGAAAIAAGGGGGPMDSAIPPEALTPEALPPFKPVGETLPAAARLVYTDQKTVWAVDRQAGARQLVKAEGANTPQVSPDGQQVLYRNVSAAGVELWVVGWDGGEPRLVLSERVLPKTGLGAQYSERRLEEARWVAGQPYLAVKLSVVPAPAFPDAPYKTELWYLDVTSGELRYVVDLGSAVWWPAFSPQGDRFALLQYGAQEVPGGTLILYDADGSAARVALRFPAGPAKASYEGQLAWMPDGRSLLLALPDADSPESPPLNGSTLYRAPLDGEAEAVAWVDASQVAWSPDASRLLLVRYLSDDRDVAELYLAGGDGRDPQLYTTIRYGGFVSWSPDGARFIYQDSFQFYAGGFGVPPQRLGNAVSLLDPRWVSADQFVSLYDAGADWTLTLRGLDGGAASLLMLPRGAMVDVKNR